jgi:myo-inositol 2-dehydrogenase / D-chiro-inositol 1-dehydrogenase
MTLKIAFIGCGWIAQACHGPVCAAYATQHSDVQLAACCDLDPQRAARLCEHFGFQRTYSDALDMLDTERPGAVFLNVPPEQTAGLAQEVMRRGIPLLCEKPPALTSADLERLVNAAAHSGGLHQVAFNRRFMPLVVELKHRLADLSIDAIEVQQVREHRTDPVFATTAVHGVDLARHLADCDYARVDLHYQELPELGPGVANYRLEGAFTSGASVHIGIYPAAGVNLERTAVYARDQAFFLEANNGPDAPGRLRHFRAGRLEAEIPGPALPSGADALHLNGFYDQDVSFLEAVQAGAQPVHDFASSRQAVGIMQAMIERRDGYGH